MPKSTQLKLIGEICESSVSAVSPGDFPRTLREWKADVYPHTAVQTSSLLQKLCTHIDESNCCNFSPHPAEYVSQLIFVILSEAKNPFMKC